VVLIADWESDKHELITMTVKSQWHRRLQNGQSARAPETCVHGYWFMPKAMSSML